ncbi:hypothetical protein ACIA49_17915 [Kribbella sp. NPDC051587]|uniref:hypothetical protein n=1 Tax=Kribbella sp. NPDC051587 TaxID=3364119 RepID=UPI003787EA58
MTVPVISITDLYDPPEHPGGALDLILPYGLPELDLRAVILDRSTEHRPGARDAGVIAMIQLNAIFGRDVPFARSPSAGMHDPNDSMYDAPPAQQRGIQVLLHALADSPEPVHVLSFGSACSVAVAYNRAPEILHEKVARIHLSGTADPHALRRITDAGLPVSPGPAAGCTLPDLKWIEDLHPWLRRYLGYALGGLSRPDLLRALEEEAPAEVMADIYQRSYEVRQLAVWMQLAGICTEQAMTDVVPALFQSFRPGGRS